MIRFLGRLFNRKPKARVVTGRYDAAQDRELDWRHWANSDLLGPNRENRPEVRRKLRQRARYEVANNCYAAALVDLYALYLLGSRVTLRIAGVSRSVASSVERLWASWADEVELEDKLRQLVRARVIDGEALALLTTVDHAHPVKLSLQPIECDRLVNPNPAITDIADGIILGRDGRPVAYQILRQHPGDMGVYIGLQADKIPADQVIHYFVRRRPEQLRGVSELTPGLLLFAQLRRYTAAVLTTAETAAQITGLVYTDAPAVDMSAEPWSVVEIERGALMTLPAGYRLAQVQPAQPASTHEMFVRSLLTELSRVLQIPVNVLMGDSSAHNYASGRLDWQAWHRRLACDRVQLERVVLNRLFANWLDEASLAGIVPEAVQITPIWQYEGAEHVDPVKEAQAAQIRLQSGLTTLANEYAKQGLDWEDQIEQLAREQSRMRELGVELKSVTGVVGDEE